MDKNYVTLWANYYKVIIKFFFLGLSFKKELDVDMLVRRLQLILKHNKFANYSKGNINGGIMY